MKKHLYSMFLYEITGGTALLLYLFLLGIKNAYLVYAVPLGIPIGMILEIVGNWVFAPVRYISFHYDINKQPKIKSNASENLLFVLNVSRSYFLLFITLPFFLIKLDQGLLYSVIQYGSWSIALVFLWNVLRFEYYFRNNLYNRLAKRKLTFKSRKKILANVEDRP